MSGTSSEEETEVDYDYTPTKKRKVEAAAGVPLPCPPTFPGISLGNAVNRAQDNHHQADSSSIDSLTQHIIRLEGKLDGLKALMLTQNSALLQELNELKKVIVNMQAYVTPGVMKLNFDIPIKPEVFPINSIDELVDLERSISDKSNTTFNKELASYCGTIACSRPNWRDGIKALLLEILTTDVQIMINWEGKSRKSNARSLPKEFPHFLRMLHYVMRNHPTASEHDPPTFMKDVSKEIQKWLRQSGDRHKRKGYYVSVEETSLPGLETDG